MMNIDPVLEAIKDFEKLRKIIENNDKLGSKFRSRTRFMLSLIEDTGLVAALSFCYGKAEHETYENIIRVWHGEEEKLQEGEEEKKSYALYLYLVLQYLKKLGIISVDDVNNPISAFRTLEEKGTVTSRLIKSYLTHLKRFAEAVYKPEREIT
ncbi:MAG: type III-B CRISPR module-associated protein Cmr5 [Candidatus Baldrarchaeia archaeon]